LEIIRRNDFTFGEYKGCSAVGFGNISTIRTNIMPPSSGSRNNPNKLAKGKLVCLLFSFKYKGDMFL
jgi:hypothetical protein